MKRGHHRSDSRERRGVAPQDLIREDFKRLSNQVLRTNWRVETLIFVQSIEGHAHEGHGAFRGERFPNTTTYDAVEALGLGPAKVARERQDLIDEIFDWAEAALAGKGENRLVTAQGEPLLGIGWFRELEVEPEQVLRGVYLGGMRDDPEVRQQVEQRYGVVMGGGRCYMVDRDVMEEMELDGYALAKTANEQRLEEYYQRRLIVAEGGRENQQENQQYMYIRYRVGPGASDDAAILAGGFLYDPSVAMGVFLADAIDTLEKFVPVYSDQDEELAQRVAKAMSSLGVSEDDLLLFTALTAVPEDLKHVMPDCSLRHFIRVDRNVDQTALESHLLFIQGKDYARQKISMEEIPNDRFYEAFTQRLRALTC